MTDTLEVFIEKILKELELENANGVGPDDDFRQLENWNSMNALIIISFINIEYGRNFTGNELSSCKTFRDVYNVIQKG